MATLVHRRLLPPRPEEAGGPGAKLGPLLAPLGPIGWTSALLALVWIVGHLWPSVANGSLDPTKPGAAPVSLLATVGGAALVALPAALELGFGFPAVRRRNPWLLAGFSLFAVAQLSQPVVAFLRDRVVANVDPGMESAFDPGTPLGLALGLLGLASTLIWIAGGVAVIRGLNDARARPPRLPVLILALAVAVSMGLLYLPYLGPGPVMALNVASLALTLVFVALRVTIAVQLAWGASSRLVPVVAWRLGAVAGALVVLGHLANIAAFGVAQAGGPDADLSLATTLLNLTSVSGAGAWCLLLAACLGGLGRGTARRAARSRLLHRYELGTEGSRA
jgi:hypothetical protein